MNKKIIFILSLFFLFLFFSISFCVHQKWFNAFDHTSIKLLQQTIPHAIDPYLSLLSLIGSFEITGMFLFVLLLLQKNLRNLLFTFVFFAGAHIIEIIGKAFLYHPGPPRHFFRYSIDFLFPSAFVKPGSSYPSGHSLRIIFLAIIVSYFILRFRKNLRVMGIVALLCVLLFTAAMLISRVSLGEHWSSDVIGGSLLGAATSLYSLNLFSHKTLKKRAISKT